MCDCSTYLAVRRGRRSFREQVSVSQFAFTLLVPTTDAFSSFFFFFFLSRRLISLSISHSNKRSGTTTARNQSRYESADISPTGCEVRARINQAAQLGRLYSQNLAILLLESVPVGTKEQIRIARHREFLFVLTGHREQPTTRRHGQVKQTF